MNELKVRWKAQESAFALIVFSFLVVERIVRIGTVPENELMRAAGAAFDPVRNYIVPVLLTAGPVVGLILLVNHWLFPKYLRHRQAIIILPLAGLLAWLLLLVCWRWGAFFNMYYLRIKLGRAEILEYATTSALQSASIIFLFYSLYLAVRELIIRWLNPADNSRRILVLQVNQVTAVVFTYIGTTIFLLTFRLLQSDVASIVYVFVLVPAIVSFFTNLYTVFPTAKRARWSTGKLLLRLLLLPAILCLFGWILFTQIGNKPLLPLLYLAYVLVVTLIAAPAGWLFYQLQKDRMETLRGLQAEVGRKDADLNFLRSQINPHFLFNTLNTLYGTALAENATRSAAGIQKLGDMMRFMLHENHRDTIPLSRELDYLENYISLQRLRFQSVPGIRLEVSILREGCSHDVVPMLLIPFVENAFKHGIRLTRESFILVNFHCSQQKIFLEVVNSVHPAVQQQDETGDSGVGLENVKQRLKLLYGEAYSLSITRDDAAFQVSLSVDLSTNKK